MLRSRIAVKKGKLKQPKAPAARADTIRHDIISVLTGRTMSARQISGEVGISEKDVYQHLEHVRKTLESHTGKLVVVPARCRRCGFEFKKREKLKKPGKCPACKGEFIEDPIFSVER